MQATCCAEIKYKLVQIFYFFPLMVKSNKKDQALTIPSGKLPRSE